MVLFFLKFCIWFILITFSVRKDSILDGSVQRKSEQNKSIILRLHSLSHTSILMFSQKGRLSSLHRSHQNSTLVVLECRHAFQHQEWQEPVGTIKTLVVFSASSFSTLQSSLRQNLPGWPDPGMLAAVLKVAKRQDSENVSDKQEQRHKVKAD